MDFLKVAFFSSTCHSTYQPIKENGQIFNLLEYLFQQNVYQKLLFLYMVSISEELIKILKNYIKNSTQGIC